MQRILVTGGAGYIGSHTVVELHNNGYHPILIDNFANSERSVIDRLQEICGTDIEWYEEDCTDRKAMLDLFEKLAPIDGVIHFAAYKAVGESVTYPLKYYHNNLGSLVTLVEAMERNGVKNLVFSSSCTVYGQPDHLPVTESSPLQEANSPYGYTKQAGERLLRDVTAREGNEMTSVLLRYFNPIGAHPSGLIGELPLGKPENLVPYITQTAAGIREELTVFGDDYSTEDGTCIRDYIHVVDLAKAHVMALDWANNNSGSCGVFNLGTGRGNSVKELVDVFEEVNQLSLNYKFGPRRPGDVEQIYADPTLAEQELGWKCEYDLADALKHAWNWQTKLKK